MFAVFCEDIFFPRQFPLQLGVVVVIHIYYDVNKAHVFWQADLAVHKKKIEDLADWLCRAKQNKRKVIFYVCAPVLLAT